VNLIFPDVAKTIMLMAVGKITAPPFSDEQITALRLEWFSLLDDPNTAAKVPDFQPFFLHAMSQTLMKMGDPYWLCLDSIEDSYSTGVPVGFNCKMPRCPAVFNKKRKHRKYELSEVTEDMANYPSAEAAGEALGTQFREEEALGMMYPTSLAEAKRQFGSTLRISAQGAIQKPDGTWRPLHDATHGVGINAGIKRRDQLEFPRAGEAATIQRLCKQDMPGVHFSLAADISKAHRRVVRRPLDRGLLACRSSNDPAKHDPIWINRVGTFGFGCVAYWWSRLAGLAGRLVSRLWLNSFAIQLVFADDIQFIAG
jgi:hypothetical protein